MLFHTGITDLDADGDYDSEGEVESYRYAGLVLQVNIYYSNDVHAFSGRSYRCALLQSNKQLNSSKLTGT